VTAAAEAQAGLVEQRGQPGFARCALLDPAGLRGHPLLQLAQGRAAAGVLAGHGALSADHLQEPQRLRPQVVERRDLGVGVAPDARILGLDGVRVPAPVARSSANTAPSPLRPAGTWIRLWSGGAT